jgi:hypothetical protein
MCCVPGCGSLYRGPFLVPFEDGPGKIHSGRFPGQRSGPTHGRGRGTDQDHYHGYRPFSGSF